MQKVTPPYRKAYHTNYVITTGYHMLPHVLPRKRKKTERMTQNRLSNLIKLYHKSYHMQKSYHILSQGLPHKLCNYHSLTHVTTRFVEKKKENRVYDPKSLK